VEIDAADATVAVPVVYAAGTVTEVVWVTVRSSVCRSVKLTALLLVVAVAMAAVVEIVVLVAVQLVMAVAVWPVLKILAGATVATVVR
jgi:hypothetical protein